MPAERREVSRMLGKDLQKHREWVVEKYREMRAVVRCTCGYTPEVLKSMDWEALRQAYMDCRLVMELGRTRIG